MIKKFFRWMNETVEYPDFDRKIHVECDECNGTAIDFLSGRCKKCKGAGFVEKDFGNGTIPKV